MCINFSTLQTTIAHSYASMECRMDSLLELRKQFKEEGINVSVNDLIIKAVAVALSRCPEMNCVWQGDQVRQEEWAYLGSKGDAH